MKKETVILVVVIAFLVGFVSGATVAILRGKKGEDQTVRLPQNQKPQIVPQEVPPPPGPPPAEVSLKIDGLKEIVKKDPKTSELVESKLYLDPRGDFLDKKIAKGPGKQSDKRKK